MTDFIQPVFTEFIWALGGGLLGALLALYVGLQAGQGRRPPPLLWGAPLAVLLLSVVLGGVGGLLNEDAWTGTMAAVLLRWLGCFAVVPFASLWLMGLGFLAIRRGPYHRTAPALVLVLALLTAGATFVEGTVGGNPIFGGVRAIVYVALGLLSALPALGVASDGSRGWAAQMGAVVFPLVVVSIEAGERALVDTMILRNASWLDSPEKRTQAAEVMLERVAPEIPYGMAAVGLSLCVPLVVFALHQAKVTDRSGLLALLALVVVPLVYYVGLPDSDVLVGALHAFPDRVTP